MSRRAASLLRRMAVVPPIFLIRLYKAAISPLLSPACRYVPTCSTYFEEALSLWGPVRGTLLGIRRLLRCQPFHAGGFDPVPIPPSREGGSPGNSEAEGPEPAPPANRDRKRLPGS